MKVFVLVSVATAALLLCSCALHRPGANPQPLVPSPAAYLQAPKPHIATAVPAPWWRAFQDPALDRLIHEALGQNLELKQLSARIAQAAALRRQAGARLFPTVDADATYQNDFLDTRSRDSDEGHRENNNEAISLGALLDWELDLWGRLRSARQSRWFEQQAAIHDWEGGRLLLSASVAEVYFELLEQLQQRQLLNDQLEVNRTLLDLTKLRFGQGQSSIVAVLQQQEQLAATQARLPEVETRVQELQHALNTLLGQAASDPWLPDVRQMPMAAGLPNTGIPADLLLKRPDLQAAQARVSSVDARIAEAIADRLPRIAIGSPTVAAGNPDISGIVASAFASMAAPVFDAGLRKAEVDRRRAEFDEALAAFSHDFLLAIQEVESALARQQGQAERLRLLEDQLAIARQLLSETRNQYSQGLTDYLPVLSAVVTVQNLERDLLRTRRVWLSSRVALHRALGGPMDSAGRTDGQTVRRRTGWGGRSEQERGKFLTQSR